MTSAQIELVKSTWEHVKPISDQAAQMFYAKLFEMKPEYRSMFPDDMKSQGKKLMTMITTAVSSLDRLEAILPAVQELGRRHVSYGVTAADYEPVGEALLWTLEKGLGDSFTPEVRAAWTETYTVLADVMREGEASAAAAG